MSRSGKAGIPDVGDEIYFFESDGVEDWTRHEATVRVAPSSPHLKCHLIRTSDGQQFNNVENVENWQGQNKREGHHYWEDKLSG